MYSLVKLSLLVGANIEFVIKIILFSIQMVAVLIMLFVANVYYANPLRQRCRENAMTLKKMEEEHDEVLNAMRDDIEVDSEEMAYAISDYMRIQRIMHTKIQTDKGTLLSLRLMLLSVVLYGFFMATDIYLSFLR